MSHALGWYYMMRGIVNDEMVGPVSGEEMLQLAFDGILKLDTPLLHPKQTKNAWTQLAAIPALKKRLEEGEQAKQRALIESKEARRQAKERKLAAMQEVKEAAARQRELRQAELEAARRGAAMRAAIQGEIVDDAPETHQPRAETAHVQIDVGHSGSVSHGFGTGLGFALGLLAVLIGLPVLACAGCFCVGFMSSLDSVPTSSSTGSFTPSTSSSFTSDSLDDPSDSITAIEQNEGLKVLDISARVTETNEVYWQFSWILRVQNRSGRSLGFNAKIEFLDADDFVISTANEYGLVVAAYSEQTFRGTELITLPGARNVASYNAIIEQR